MAHNGIGKNEPEFLVALARGHTVRAAAQANGICERTAYRRAQDPDFRQQVAAVRGQLIDAAAGALAETGVQAVETLKALLDSEKEPVRLGAAKAVLTQLARMARQPQAEEPAESPAAEERLATLHFDPRDLSSDELVLVRALVFRSMQRAGADEAALSAWKSPSAEELEAEFSFLSDEDREIEAEDVAAIEVEDEPLIEGDQGLPPTRSG